MWINGGITAPGYSYFCNKIAVKEYGFEEYATNSQTDFAFNYNGYAGGTTQYRNFTVYDGKHTQLFKITAGVSPTSEYLGTLKLKSGTGNTYATRYDSLYFARTDYPTSYLNKITNSNSGTAADSSMTFELATGASTFAQVLSLRGNGSVVASGDITSAGKRVPKIFTSIASTTGAQDGDIAIAGGTAYFLFSGNWQEVAFA